MLYEESRARQLTLLASAETIRVRAEWDQIQKLDRLQRSVRLVRARLGMTPATAA
jgi:hypothetical protein